MYSNACFNAFYLSRRCQICHILYFVVLWTVYWIFSKKRYIFITFVDADSDPDPDWQVLDADPNPAK